MNSEKRTSEFTAANHLAISTRERSRRDSLRVVACDLNSKSIGCGATLGIMTTLRSLGPLLVSLLVLGLVVYGGWRAVSNYLDMPVVHKSQDTGECVEVEQPKDKHYTCDNLPPKYETAWVL